MPRGPRSKQPLIYIRLSSPLKLLRAFVVSSVSILFIYGLLGYEPRRAGIWFGDVTAPLVLNEEELGALVRQAVDGVFGDRLARARLGALRGDAAPRVVFLSVSDGSERATISIGSGRGIVAALEEAILDSRKPARRVYSPRWLKLDFVQQVSSDPAFTFGSEISRASQGLAFARDTGVAFLPEELEAYGLVGEERILDAGRVRDLLARRATGGGAVAALATTEGPVTVHWFTTLSLFSDGKRFVALKGGARDGRDLSADSLGEAIAFGIDYLNQLSNIEGRFVGGLSSISREYDLFTHGGALWSLAEHSDFVAGSASRDAFRRGVEFLRDHRPNNLGAQSLGLVAMLRLKRSGAGAGMDDLARQMAEQILMQQNADGSFRTKAGTPLADEHPGAAVYALWEYGAAEPGGRYARAAEKGAEALLRRDRNLSDARLPADVWFARALSSMIRKNRNPRYLTHLMRITGAFAERQNRTAVFPEWQGSFFRPPQMLATAMRLEVMCEGHRVAAALGQRDIAAKLLESVELAAGFSLRNQFLPESVMYVERPERKLGGFRRGVSDFEVSLESVHHSLSGLLCFYRHKRESGAR